MLAHHLGQINGWAGQSQVAVSPAPACWKSGRESCSCPAIPEPSRFVWAAFCVFGLLVS